MKEVRPVYLRLFIKIIWHRYSIPPGTRTWTPSSRSFITPSSRSFITPSSRRFITPSSRRFITRRRRRSSRRPRRVPAVVSGFRPGSVQTRLLFFLESVTLQTIQDLPPRCPAPRFFQRPCPAGFSVAYRQNSATESGAVRTPPAPARVVF